jgi:hypothetical protein
MPSAGLIAIATFTPRLVGSSKTYSTAGTSKTSASLRERSDIDQYHEAIMSIKAAGSK